MYTHCFVCRRPLGANEAIPHLTIGRRIAFDVDRGRLWVVCARCGQWCLTPMEDRWEAIAECEALFTGAEARVSTANVGLARSGDVELIRIGPALRDEIANWRYGPRLARRRRLARIAAGTAAVGAGIATAGAIYLIGTLAVATSSAFVGGWFAMLGTAYAYKLREISAFTPVARLDLRDGGRRTLLRSHLASIYLVRRHVRPHARVRVALGDLEVTYSEDDALTLLSRVLPHANWRGASPAEIDGATKAVDAAERASHHRRDDRSEPWERLVAARDAGPRSLTAMSVVERLALR